MVRAVTSTPRADRPFEVISDFKPAGDQPEAIRQLAERVNRGEPDKIGRAHV